MVRVLFELEECRGWTLRAAWDDLKFGLKHRSDFERCAVVGQKRWQKWMTNLSKPFFKVKYFDKSEMEKAWQWVQENGSGGATNADRRDGAHRLADKDLVDVSSEDSFPASDPPSWTPMTGS
jgi:hypothetical protein